MSSERRLVQMANRNSPVASAAPPSLRATGAVEASNVFAPMNAGWLFTKNVSVPSVQLGRGLSLARSAKQSRASASPRSPRCARAKLGSSMLRTASGPSSSRVTDGEAAGTRLETWPPEVRALMDQHVAGWIEDSKGERSVYAVTVAAPRHRSIQSCVTILHLCGCDTARQRTRPGAAYSAPRDLTASGEPPQPGTIRGSSRPADGQNRRIKLSSSRGALQYDGARVALTDTHIVKPSAVARPIRLSRSARSLFMNVRIT